PICSVTVSRPLPCAPPFPYPTLFRSDHDRVVLVDDRYHTLREHPTHRLPCEQVLLAVGQHVTGEEDLARHPTMGRKRLRIAVHETPLTDRGGHLQSGHVSRARLHSEGRHARCHRPGRHQHGRVALVPGHGHFRGYTLNSLVVEDAIGSDETRRTHLDHQAAVGTDGPSHSSSSPAGPGWVYSNASPPIRTSSPASAPAPANARSTPRRARRSAAMAAASGCVTSANATARSAAVPTTRQPSPSRWTVKGAMAGRCRT